MDKTERKKKAKETERDIKFPLPVANYTSEKKTGVAVV